MLRFMVHGYLVPAGAGPCQEPPMSEVGSSLCWVPQGRISGGKHVMYARAACMCQMALIRCPICDAATLAERHD